MKPKYLPPTSEAQFHQGQNKPQQAQPDHMHAARKTPPPFRSAGLDLTSVDLACIEALCACLLARGTLGRDWGGTLVYHARARAEAERNAGMRWLSRRQAAAYGVLDFFLCSRTTTA